MQMLKASKIFDRNRRFALVDNAWSLVRRGFKEAHCGRLIYP
jgi:hypothetical protein